MKRIICQTFEIAKMLGITRTQVFECIVEGMPRIKRNEFDFLVCLKWYFSDLAKLRVDRTIEERKQKANWELIENKFNQLTQIELPYSCKTLRELSEKFYNKNEVQNENGKCSNSDY